MCTKPKILFFVILLFIGKNISAQSITNIKPINSDSSIIEQLDILLSTWYAKKSAYHEKSQAPVVEKNLPYTDADSIMMYRLKKLTDQTVFPMVFNDEIRAYINMYIRRNRSVSVMLGLAKYYFPMFEQTMDKYNCPLELKYLAVIESALNPIAVSRAGATGLWQFMYNTGKMYGLEVSTMVDYRCDPYRATDAAARHLKDLSVMFEGDWVLALAAYNCGPGNVKKAIVRSGGKTNFWEIYNYLPKETRGYVPAFYGAWYAMSYYDKYGILPTEMKYGQVDTFAITQKLHFEQISSVINISVEEIKALNPQYKRNIIPLSDDPMYLVLPVEYSIAFEMKKDSIFNFKPEKYSPTPSISLNSTTQVASSASGDYKQQPKIHIIKSGESLSIIARKYKTTTSELAKLNKISVNTTIHPGKKLIVGYNKIPVSKPNPTPANNPPATKSPADSLSKAHADTLKINNENTNLSKSYLTYKVVEGDTLHSIANKFENVTVAELRKVNQLKETDILRAGQSLQIPVF